MTAIISEYKLPCFLKILLITTAKTSMMAISKIKAVTRRQKPAGFLLLEKNTSTLLKNFYPVIWKMNFFSIKRLTHLNRILLLKTVNGVCWQ